MGTQVKVTQKATIQIKQGYSLIHRDAVLNANDLLEEGNLLTIVDEREHYVATGYYGVQNKGVGWILSLDKQELINQSFFNKKISAAVNKRQKFYTSDETTAFRMFNGEGDGIGGMIIDYYAGYYLIQWYSKGIYHFRHFIYQALESTPNYQGIYEKKRFDRQGHYLKQDDFVRGEKAVFPLIIKENNMFFNVHLNDGAMTGIFLDQRNVRQLIRTKYAKHNTVLNTFSYTGAFSVAALHGEAKKTINIDLAKRSVKMTQQQLKINGFEPDNEEIRVMDVFNYFKYAKRHQLSYDLVILDPPSFARSKKFTFSTEKDYSTLLMDAIAVTNKHGVIVASTNNASFGMKKFKGMIKKGFTLAKQQYQIIEEHSLPEDFKTTRGFPEFNYLKVVFIKVI